MNPFTKKVSPDNVLTVTFDKVHSGWEQYILLTSDRHWDSVHSDRRMQKKHLEQVLERDALIIDIGDLFDGMQGRTDKRGSKDGIRPELLTSDYFTRLPEAAAEWFGKYAPNWLVMGTGNHETGVLKHQEVNLSWQFARLMNAEHGGNLHLGRYSGYVRFQFKTKAQRTYLTPRVLRYHHGSGGSAEVTHGVIKTNRRSVWIPDADVFLSGHIHKTWQVPIPRERLTAQGRIYEDHAMHLSIPTYKSPPRDAGWEAEKEFPPVLKGAIWWRMYYDGNDDRRIDNEFTWVQ